MVGIALPAGRRGDRRFGTRIVNPEVQAALLARLESLPAETQQRVLDFAEALAVGLPGGRGPDELLSLSGSLDEESAAGMPEAIADGCENVDAEGW